MAKRETSQLGLTPLPQSNNGVVIYGAGSSLGQAPSQAEQKIGAEAQRQLEIIRHQRVKAEAAAHEIAQAHQQSAKEFSDTLGYLAALNEEAKGKSYQNLLEEFNQRNIQLTAQHLFGVTEVSARNIGMETARPLYWEEEKIVVKMVEKPGLLRRLIGD